MNWTIADITNDINTLLLKHGINEKISPSELVVTRKTISEGSGHESRLSDIIIEKTWPSIKEAEVYHFTQLEAAKNILSTETFRLTNIDNRFDEGEIINFYKMHNLGYYKIYNEDHKLAAKNYRKTIVPSLFYASFTQADIPLEEQEYFWRIFASNGGARLKFKITAKNCHFRKIYYEENSKIPLLEDIIQLANKKYDRTFILRKNSTMCAFYLKGETYRQEKEIRVVCKDFRTTEYTENTASKYIEIPLNQQNQNLHIQLLEVCTASEIIVPPGVNLKQRTT